MLHDRDTALANIVHTDGQAEKLRLGPDVAAEGDALGLVLCVEGRDGGVVRDLLGHEAQVVVRAPRNGPVWHSLPFWTHPRDLPVASGAQKGL